MAADLTGGSAIQRKRLYLFFVLDTSGSMETHGNINAVNVACGEALRSPEIQNAGGAKAEIYVNILSFSNGCEWMFPQPLPIADAASQWRDLNAEGCTNMGEACRELNRKLRRDGEGFLKAEGGLAKPVIIFMTDGEPTDDFEGGLKDFQGNKYYKQYIKVACAVEDADETNLVKFTGSKELVMKSYTPEALKKWIKVVTLVTSDTGSKLSIDGSADAGEEIAEKLKEELEDDPGLQPVDTSDYD